MGEQIGKTELQRGILLVAPPNLSDPNFRRSVVLLCDHSAEGSFGLILNQHTAIDMKDVWPGQGVFKEVVRAGGPVQMDTLHFLHRFGEDLSDAVEICPDVFWGGDFDALQHTARGGNALTSGVRFYLGYAGWSEGQLQAEIEAGGWIMTRADSELVFDIEPELLWRAAMIRMGGEYALLSNYPDDPLLN